jgi:hypothetical protein
MVWNGFRSAGNEISSKSLSWWLRFPCKRVAAVPQVSVHGVFLSVSWRLGVRVLISFFLHPVLFQTLWSLKFWQYDEYIFCTRRNVPGTECIGSTYLERIVSAHLECIGGAHLECIGGAHLECIGGAHLECIGGAPLECIGGAPLECIGSAPLECIGGAPLECIGGAHLECIGGAHLECIGGAHLECIGGAHLESLYLDPLAICQQLSDFEELRWCGLNFSTCWTFHTGDFVLIIHDVIPYGAIWYDMVRYGAIWYDIFVNCS